MHPRRTQHTIVLLLYIYIKKKQHEQISRRYCVYDTKLKNETAITNEISVLLYSTCSRGKIKTHSCTKSLKPAPKNTRYCIPKAIKRKKHGRVSKKKNSIIGRHHSNSAWVLKKCFYIKLSSFLAVYNF
jgi:hypothetical protein